jgi:starch synthase
VKPLHVAHLSSEAAPLAKVGGLADVVGALSAEQARRGHRVTVALPAYGSLVRPAGWEVGNPGGCEVPWGMGREPARFELLHDPAGNRRVLLVHHEGERRFFDRPGIYNEPATGEAHPDNAERYLFFTRAAIEGLKRLGEPVDVLHAHDHQTAWAPCFLRTHESGNEFFRGAACLFTIHNLGYQGIYDSWVLALAGFPLTQFFPGSPFEYWGRVNFMKVGLAFADMLSTVSPRYAREIQTDGEFGFGLEGMLARRSPDLVGILNGIDDTDWNPAIDPHLPQRYDAGHLEGKNGCRAALARACGFGADDRAIVGIISRLVEQKGFDLIEEARSSLLGLDARFVVLGFGQPRYQEMVRQLAVAHPDRVSHRAEQNEAFAHMVEAGSDLFLMPSRYEPCGLNQMYSLRYGTPPVVRATGGLADTVEEFDVLTRDGTGFLFQSYDASEMVAALKRAIAIRRQPELWRTLQRNGMSRDFSWRASADGYDRLYAEARERVATGRVLTLEAARSPI